MLRRLMLLGGFWWLMVILPATAPAKSENVREMLQRFSIEGSHLATLVDGRSLSAAELPLLMRLLLRVGTIPQAELERLAQPTFDLDALRKNPAARRGEIDRLVGQVVAVEPCMAPAPLVERFGFEQYYRCELKLSGSATPVVVYTRLVPEAWREGGEIQQRGGALGIFLKLSSTDPALPAPLFVASRLAWYRADLLGDLAMDFGLLSTLKGNRPLLGEEQEAFYQTLAAVGRAKPGELLRQADAELHRSGRRNVSVVPLFNQPDQQTGRLVVLEGSARSVVEVPVDDPELAARFGISHYYQITLFTYGTPRQSDADSQGNPLVVCVRELPSGMPIGDDPGYAAHVRVAGFYFKKWSYPISRPGEKSVLQLAPLVIGQQPVWHAAAGQPWGWISQVSAAALLVLGVLLLCRIAAGGVFARMLSSHR